MNFAVFRDGTDWKKDIRDTRDNKDILATGVKRGTEDSNIALLKGFRMSLLSKLIHLRIAFALSPLFFLVLLLFSGCASDLTLQYISSIENNQPLDTANLYKEELDDKGKNLELYLMEKGKIAQLYGDFDTSRESFNAQIDIMKERELHDDTTQGAQINVGSVVVNDNMLPYKARLFEVEMLRLYQSINYMSKGNLEGALIEIRNAEFLMNEAEKARASEKFNDSDFNSFENGVAKKALSEDNDKGEKPDTVAPKVDEKKSEPVKTEPDACKDADPNAKAAEPPLPKEGETSGKVDPAVTNQPGESTTAKTEPPPAPPKTEEQVKQDEVKQKAEGEYGRYFEDMKDVLAKSKSSFLNPYVVYMGGLIHEMSGELNDAYISYKKGLQIMPFNPYLQRDTIRLANQLNQDQDFDWLKTSFPDAWAWNESHPQNGSLGRLVVIYEDGWAPRKEEVFITMLAVAIAYPVYRFNWTAPSPLTASTGSPDALVTYPLCYMNALALRALEEEAKWRIIRQSARVVVKGGTFAAGAVMTATGNNAVQAAGIGIMVASAIYNNMTEKADLRSWMTLPENVQILVADLPEGKTDLKLSCPNMQTPASDQISIAKGQTTVVRVVRVGERVIVQNLWPAPPVKAEEEVK